MLTAHKVTFEGSLGEPLAARIDMPVGPVRAYALFAHCFTCSKDVFAASRISADLAGRGIAVLRFDFTGLGGSGGDFGNTNFSSNVRDILKAADFLRESYQAPSLLIGHSLGGAAVLIAAGHIPEVKAVATVGAPAEVEHVLKNFGAGLEEIEAAGEADVSLGKRVFRIRRDFVDDARAHSLRSSIASLKKALLVLHSPTDSVVGVENAREIFDAARHPKSFVSLDGADHLLSRKSDAIFAAEMISCWASRYLDAAASDDDAKQMEGVLVAESGLGRFQQLVRVGDHSLLSDEPASVGGDESGPSPYDLLMAALGACTSITLRMYAERKNLDLGRISVRVTRAGSHVADCEDCVAEHPRPLRGINRVIWFEGDPPTEEVRASLLRIADRCPIHRALEQNNPIATELAAAGEAGTADR